MSQYTFLVSGYRKSTSYRVDINKHLHASLFQSRLDKRLEKKIIKNAGGDSCKSKCVFLTLLALAITIYVIEHMACE